MNNDRLPTQADAKPGPGAPTEVFQIAKGLFLREFFAVIRKRLWVIVLMATALTGVAIGFSLLQTPVYESSIVILIAQDESSAEPGQLQGEILGLQQVTQTMVEGVASRPIANAVIERLGLQTTPEEFLENLNAEQVRATQFVQVDYRDTSPEGAQQVANTVGEVFSERVTEVSPSAGDITATVWQPAEVPDKPVIPNPVLYTGVALAIGVMLGVALAFLLEYLNNSWGSLEEVEGILGVPAFGAIPEYKVSRGKE